MAKNGLVQSDDEIEKAVMTALKDELNQAFRAAGPRIEARLRKAIGRAIVNSPEYQSLTSPTGKLRGELGIENTNQLEVILNAIVETTQVTFKPLRLTSALTLVGGLEIKAACLVSFSEILQLPSASYVSEKGKRINWLEWLLLRGDETIIVNYEVAPGNRFEKANVSRTSLAIMKKSKNGKWHVPREYAGVKSNNWVTRSIEGIDVEMIVQSELMK